MRAINVICCLPIGLVLRQGWQQAARNPQMQTKIAIQDWERSENPCMANFCAFVGEDCCVQPVAAQKKIKYLVLRRNFLGILQHVSRTFRQGRRPQRGDRMSVRDTFCVEFQSCHRVEFLPLQVF